MLNTTLQSGPIRGVVHVEYGTTERSLTWVYDTTEMVRSNCSALFPLRTY